LTDVPVEKKHGLTSGRVMKAEQIMGHGRNRFAWVMGDAGERVKLLDHEFKVLPEEEQDAR
jgi:hypothetical protein